MTDEKLIIVAGSNGCGKTTFAEEYLSQYFIDYVNADDIYRINNSQGNYTKIQAGKIFFNKIEDYINHRKSLIIESTLSGITLMNRILESSTIRLYDNHLLYIS